MFRKRSRSLVTCRISICLKKYLSCYLRWSNSEILVGKDAFTYHIRLKYQSFGGVRSYYEVKLITKYDSKMWVVRVVRVRYRTGSSMARAPFRNYKNQMLIARMAVRKFCSSTIKCNEGVRFIGNSNRNSVYIRINNQN